jgi:demethoxyubiquinone hydroxylase (CLK1/Coq7/Cat5 family)
MRVNHVGEVCAQALYQGQALTARDESARDALGRAAREEEDHLAWSAERIRELGGRPSLLNPLWYAGSLAMGVAAGALGDKWNLAFLAETEHQVEQHCPDICRRCRSPTLARAPSSRRCEATRRGIARRRSRWVPPNCRRAPGVPCAASR